jgi:hypothetical protein
MFGGAVALTGFLGLLLIVLLFLNRRDRRRAAIAAMGVGVETFRARARVTLDMRGCVAQEVRQVAERGLARAPESVSFWIRVR